MQTVIMLTTYRQFLLWEKMLSEIFNRHYEMIIIIIVVTITPSRTQPPLASLALFSCDHVKVFFVCLEFYCQQQTMGMCGMVILWVPCYESTSLHESTSDRFDGEVDECSLAKCSLRSEDSSASSPEIHSTTPVVSPQFISILKTKNSSICLYTHTISVSHSHTHTHSHTQTYIYTHTYTFPFPLSLYLTYIYILVCIHSFLGLFWHVG